MCFGISVIYFLLEIFEYLSHCWTHYEVFLNTQYNFLDKQSQFCTLIQNIIFSSTAIVNSDQKILIPSFLSETFAAGGTGEIFLLKEPRMHQ